MTSNTDPKNENSESAEEKTLRLSDDLIAVIRELVQLSLLTGTNIVDHMRAVRVEVVNGAVLPTTDYVNAYNAQVESLAAAAKAAAEAEAKELMENESTGVNA